MKKVYAVWEGERTRDYITPGKKYEVLPSKYKDFLIVDDEDDLISCLWNNCANLNGGRWTRIEKDEEAHQTEQKTLRDEFAMAALTGVVQIKSPLRYKDYAEFAYKMADAMLEARKK